MPSPQITSMELSTGSYVPLSFDLESGTPVEIYLSGSNLQDLTDVDLDSGPWVGWYITGISSNSNSAIITAFAYGEAGSGYLKLNYRSNPVAALEIDEFWIPVLD